MALLLRCLRLAFRSMVLGVLSAAALASTASETLDQRIDRLLFDLEPPNKQALLERIGPRPSLADVLVPLSGDERPLLSREVSEEGAVLAVELRRRRRESPPEAIDERLELSWELVDMLTVELGEDHPDVINDTWAARKNELLAGLTGEDYELQFKHRNRHREAVSLFGAGNLEAALEMLMAQIELERGLFGDEVPIASELTSLCVILHAQGSYRTAEAVALEGLEQAIEERGVRHPFVANSLNSLGIFASIDGRLDEAEVLHAYSLSLRRVIWGDKGPDYALTLMHLVDLYRMQGRIEQAMAVCDRAIGILQESELWPDRLGILFSQRGGLLWGAGDEEGALHSLDEAVALLDEAHAGDHEELAKATGLYADIHRSMGHWEEALELARAAAEMLDRMHAGAHPLKGQAHLRLGQCTEALGDLEEAETEYRAALASLESGGEGVRGDRARVMECLSALLARRGDAAEAQAFSERLPDELEALHGRSRFVATALRLLARRRRAAGQLEGAIQAQREAASLYAELLGEDHGRVLQASVDLAEMLIESREFDQSAKVVRGVLDRVDTGDPAHREPRAGACLLAGRFALDRGELDSAIEFASLALKVRRDVYTAPSPELIEALTLVGEAHERRADLILAAEAYEEALGQSDLLRTRILGDERDRARYAGELALGFLARAVARVHLALGDPIASFEASELGRERALLDLLERADLDLVAAAKSHGDETAREIEECLKREARAEAELFRSELALREEAILAETGIERVADLEAEVREAQRQLLVCQGERESWLRKVWPSARPLTSEAIAASLDATEALLHFSFDRHGVGIVLISGRDGSEVSGYRLANSPSAALALRARVLDVARAAKTGEALDAAHLESLSEQLLPQDLWTAIGECQRVIIVPDGPLHELPFELLSTPRGRWLEQGPRIVYSPSATLLARARLDAFFDTPMATPRAVIVGAPQFSAVERSSHLEAASRRDSRSSLEFLRIFGERLTPLPGSAVEARQVASELKRSGWPVELLLGESATCSTVKERARGVRLLHMATHGLAPDASRPYDAALALSTPNEASLGDDGFLTLEDLVRDWGGALRGCDLVVLSACDTQAGVELGESRVALSWGFFFAGASNVLVSLWKVDDRATVLLMDRFYSNYTGDFEDVRRVAGEEFSGGTRLPEDAALQESKAWLAAATPEENLRRLNALGFGAEIESVARDFPRPKEAPTSRPSQGAFDYRAPRFWSAFALYGQGD